MSRPSRFPHTAGRRVRAGRFFLAVSAAASVVLAVPSARIYRALCAGPVDTYPAFAAARNTAQVEALQQQAAAPRSWRASLAEARARLLSVVVEVKQSDGLAFPAHAGMAMVLETTRCSADAYGDQWHKAAIHAWAEPLAWFAARGLRRTTGAILGDSAVTAALERDEQALPWYDANLKRSLDAYRALRRA